MQKGGDTEERKYIVGDRDRRKNEAVWSKELQSAVTKKADAKK